MTNRTCSPQGRRARRTSSQKCSDSGTSRTFPSANEWHGRDVRQLVGADANELALRAHGPTCRVTARTWAASSFSISGRTRMYDFAQSDGPPKRKLQRLETRGYERPKCPKCRGVKLRKYRS